MSVQERDLTQRAAEIETLLGEIDAFPDPAMRARAIEIVQNLLVLYGEGLARILTIVQDGSEGPARTRLLDAFAADELVAHLLLLHDLHPVEVETRVQRALDEVRPYLQSHGGNVQFLGIVNGKAKLRLQGSCNGCPSSTLTLKLAIEEAIAKAAPDLDGIEAEGAVAPAPVPINFLPASDFAKMKGQPAPPAGWTVVPGLPLPAQGGTAATEVDGFPVLLLEIENSFYAYRNGCPICGNALDRAVLRGADLRCITCGHHYDARRAGRCLDAPDRQLEPIPLLMEADTVKLALGGRR